MTDKATTQGFNISDKSACLIGCGGLGCNIAVHLAGAGIGKLIICDFDTVSESNLNRQFIYTADDIAKPKVECMKRFLERYSDTQIEAYLAEIRNTDDLSFASGCDIVILAVDNNPARQTVKQFCDKNNIPLVFGGIDGFYGIAYLYVPGITPPPAISGEKAEYNISCTAGIIGSAQAALATQYLLNKDSGLYGKLLVFDKDTFDTLELK